MGTRFSVKQLRQKKQTGYDTHPEAAYLVCHVFQVPRKDFHGRFVHLLILRSVNLGPLTIVLEFSSKWQKAEAIVYLVQRAGRRSQGRKQWYACKERSKGWPGGIKH